MIEHELADAHPLRDGWYLVTCSCGAAWRRQRLADAAVALERHQHQNPDHEPTRAVSGARMN